MKKTCLPAFFASIILIILATPITGRAEPEIRTPQPSPAPHINGPVIFGVRPGNPFLCHIPATGVRPMEFRADNLPAGLSLDHQTGDITGSVAKAGEYTVTFHAKNAKGSDKKKFKIVVGETIALTPPMGWNSWNHYAGRVTQEIVRSNAQAMTESGLINHGWTYVNIDDTWQGQRSGSFNALQGNEKFPDMKALCDAVHKMGLKVGIYSTPWVTSYAGRAGGSAENSEGTWTPATGPKVVNQKVLPWAIGKYSFATNDAKQWAAWGFDYLKYDWNPNELPETQEMYDALRHSGRDIVFSLSNNMPLTNAAALTPIANCWRTTGDIKANWRRMIDIGFTQSRWIAFGKPGHWNDPDMLEIATKERGQPGLTPNEEYTHMTWWCLLAAPLLLGNDLTAMDPFTLNLLENDEVLAVDQDEAGKQAVPVSQYGNPIRINYERSSRSTQIRNIVSLQAWAQTLADGSQAVGLFNFGDTNATVTVKWTDLKISAKHKVRDLWRQKDLGKFEGQFEMAVAPHCAELVKISK